MESNWKPSCRSHLVEWFVDTNRQWSILSATNCVWRRSLDRFLGDWHFLRDLKCFEAILPLGTTVMFVAGFVARRRPYS